MSLENIASFHSLPLEGKGMDIIIVSTDTAQQEAFWESKLSSRRGQLFKADTHICCVWENWTGGAGNGFGTLYAFLNARKKMLERDGIDIFQSLEEGASIAIYHTAGTGKRLYPLTASEFGNKTAIKLPSIIHGQFLTVLEAVILQTGALSEIRKGRLSVFWGDQVFIPSASIKRPPQAHIDMLSIVRPIPTEEEWEKNKRWNYGLTLEDATGNAMIINKCRYSTIEQLRSSNRLAQNASGGISLGCFSLSCEMLKALLNEFHTELTEKKMKADSDPHLWMPLTLDLEIYLNAMTYNDCASKDHVAHYERMQVFKQSFFNRFKGLLFEVTDVGSGCFWWDYGTVQSYLHNNLKLCQSGPEAEAMKAFLKMAEPISHSSIRLHRIKNSVVVGVVADELNVSNSILLDSTLSVLEGDDLLFYNVAEDKALKAVSGTVRADLVLPSNGLRITLQTQNNRDGKADWQICLPNNQCSYEKIFSLIR